ncbi:unnamed protein product [Parascedosporium putredinis]|uniref:Major facilitator superfamily (MFS) profile domain-containing protein n=1 Tax=Parascedosporium putredinis TaxID=1442378 RepID=A0A9P1MD14_9PEZI|nr:unnamed protein product [Parascedosporium putredinis]CAI8002757.1 unnamed protein product [Parascedosporium putredinis]
MSDDAEVTIRAHWKSFVACGVMALSPFQYGLDFGIIGGFQAMPGFLQIYGHPAPETVLGWNISTTRQQLISSLMTLGAFTTTGLAGIIAIKLGRRVSMWLSCLLCIVANVIMMTTTHIGALYVGRLVIGLANGGLIIFSQLYIQEVSPAKYRALFFNAFQFCVSLGTLIGTIIDWATAKRPDRSAYLIPLSVVFVIPVVLIIGIFFIPESPRWLIERGQSDKGRKSLDWLRPTSVEADQEATDIQRAIELERDTKDGISVLDMFKNPIDRRRTILSICVVSLQNVPGSMFIIPYKAYFLAIAKVSDPFAMSNVLSAIGLLGLIVGASLVVRYGRRRVLLIGGLLGCGTLQLAMAVTYDKHGGTPEAGKAIVALCSVFMFVYVGAIGPYSYLIGGELPSQRLRTYTFGLSSSIGFLLTWCITFTAPYFINPNSLGWGPKYGYIWFPSAMIGALWTFLFLPELKGRTLEEIDEMVFPPPSRS